jgi:mannosyltransferase
MRTDRTAAAALTLLAAVVRIPTLAEQSFWLDEAYTVRIVRMSFGGMLRTIPKTESTPPLYYVLAWLWAHVFTDSEFGLRSLSALAGILTVPVAYAAARRLAGSRAAVIAGLLLAVSPLMVWFSQEARAYALATLLSTISVLCVIGWLQERRRRWLTAWTVSAALGLLTHYFVIFIVVPELALLWMHWLARPRRRVAIAAIPVVIVALALIPLALAQRGTGHADYIAQGSLGARLEQVPKQLLVGYASPIQAVTTAVAVVLVLAGALLPLATSASGRRRVLVPLAIGAGCVLTPVLLALVGVDFLDTRNLLPALPPLCIAAAVGFTTGSRRAGQAALAFTLAAVLLVVVVLVDANPVYQRDNWRGAASALGATALARAIVVTPGSGLYPLQVYMGRLEPLSGTVPVREVDVLAIPQQVTGEGIGIPPRPIAPLPLPAGFRLFEARYTRTYTVLRYRSPTAVPVSAASLGPDRLGSGGFAALIQRARRG